MSDFITSNYTNGYYNVLIWKKHYNDGIKMVNSIYKFQLFSKMILAQINVIDRPFSTKNWPFSMFNEHKTKSKNKIMVEIQRVRQTKCGKLEWVVNCYDCNQSSGNNKTKYLVVTPVIFKAKHFYIHTHADKWMNRSDWYVYVGTPIYTRKKRCVQIPLCACVCECEVHIIHFG